MRDFADSDIETIRNSGLLDPAWYAEQYPT